MVVALNDKGRMLWPRLNEKEQGLRIHACNTLPVAYRNFIELSTASVLNLVSQQRSTSKRLLVENDIFY